MSDFVSDEVSGDVARDDGDEEGWMRTLILPLFAGVVSNEISRPPNSAESANSSFRIVEDGENRG